MTFTTKQIPWPTTYVTSTTKTKGSRLDSAVAALLKLKWEKKRPLGKEAAKSLFWPQSFFRLPGPSLMPPRLWCQWRKQLYLSGVACLPCRGKGPPPPASFRAWHQLWRQRRQADPACPLLAPKQHFPCSLNHRLPRHRFHS